MSARHARRRGSAVLLTEASSLTAREFVTVLGSTGIVCDALSAKRGVLCEFSRWTRAIVDAPAPAADPAGYLIAVAGALRDGSYDALLPTHEQAWLLAAGRALLPADAPVALAPIEAFDRVQSKIEFARTADETGLPQPRWWPAAERPGDARFPFWLKAAFGTAGRSVQLVRDEDGERHALDRLSEAGRREVMGQQAAPGTYAQAQALFDRGRMIALHCSEQAGTGAGGSAAARVSVAHPAVRGAVERLGRHLEWHGGLTLDYFHVDGEPAFIECNPRTIEPGNAFAAGVDLPGLMIELSAGRPLPKAPVLGLPGVRTHSAMALMLGTAERTGSRREVARAGWRALAHRGAYARSAEVLTPIGRDRRSALVVARVAAALLRDPSTARHLAEATVATYSVTPEAVRALRSR